MKAPLKQSKAPLKQIKAPLKQIKALLNRIKAPSELPRDTNETRVGDI